MKLILANHTLIISILFVLKQLSGIVCVLKQLSGGINSYMTRYIQCGHSLANSMVCNCFILAALLFLEKIECFY